MAHEIKNPLTPIQLATQRLQRRFGKILCDDAVFFQCTNIILKQVALIKSLVMHFSEFATMPALQCEMADINQIVQEITDLYHLSYPDILIHVDLSKELPLISVDVKKIKRVLVNFFDNSIRALQTFEIEKGFQGEIKIITQKSDDKRWIELLFMDNGPGIAREVQDNLFLPYVSTEKKNMGLGLAIVQDIIMLHGGTICLLPCEKGVMFRIQLAVKGQN
jgi:two-component system nitrogen regulation sensor histidine kinase NtrY